MIRIIETNNNYEAVIALMKTVAKDLNSGVAYDREDLNEVLEMCDEADRENIIVHKNVLDFENKRFGGNKSTIMLTRRLIEDRIKELDKNDALDKMDFDSMSKDELIKFIKDNSVVVDDSNDDDAIVLKVLKQE